MKIDLKFDEQMTDAITAGRKCCTFRTERKGSIGDTFEVAGQTYRIVQIVGMRLARVIYDFYAAEGVESTDQMRAWAQYHYGSKFDLLLEGYVHFFARCPEEEKK